MAWWLLPPSSFRDRKVIKNYFESAIEKTGKEIPWHVIDMSKRSDGREEMLNVLERELELVD